MSDQGKPVELSEDELDVQGGGDLKFTKKLDTSSPIFVKASAESGENNAVADTLTAEICHF